MDRKDNNRVTLPSISQILNPLEEPQPETEPVAAGTAKRFKCPHCDKSFTRKYNMQSHLRVHTDDRPFECEHCQATFVRKHDLRRHIRSIHSEDRPHNCPNCHMSFARSDGLKRHLESERRAGNHPR